ncbi:MAG TPA: hypothetical protein P5535_06405, partial [Clostridia bacterium]|nr:hypothetical protein [Clostridia bacterium]
MLGVLVICLAIVLLLITANNIILAKIAERDKNRLLEETDRRIVLMYTKQVEMFDSVASNIANSDMLSEYADNIYYLDDIMHDNSDIFRYFKLMSNTNEYIDHIMIYDYELEYLLNGRNEFAAYV